MRTVLAVVLWGSVLVVVPGCDETGVFQCSDDRACLFEGIPGTCEEPGYCSFPDGACSSGRRFGKLAPAGVARECVPADDATGSSEGGSDSGSSGEPPAMANLAFVSSEKLAPTEDIVTKADALCRRLAEDAGLPGSYVAWVSSVGEDAKDRLRHEGVLARGWARIDGRPFANEVPDLLAGRIWYPLSIDERGQPVDSAAVLTATNGAGEVSSRCANWERLDDTGEYRVGRTDGTFQRWTNQGTLPCDESARIYCFGVDHVVDVGRTPDEGRLAFISDQPLSADAGRDAFDEACRDSAARAGLAGEYLAAVAIDGAPALSRFEESDETWVNTLGVPLFTGDAPLPNLSFLETSVGYQADGTPIDVLYWAGADAAGLPATDQSCLDWTTSSPDVHGRASRSSQSRDWFGSVAVDCDEPRHVLCLAR